MATRVVIDTNKREGSVKVTVTDDTGRNDVRTFPRYPHPASAPYVRFVDALDMAMAQDEDDEP